MKSLIIRCKPYWEELIGPKPGMPMKGLIFHSVCLLTLVAMLCDMIFAFSIGLPSDGMMMGVFSVLLGLIYYFSRYRRETKLAITLYGLTSHFFYLLNFYLNGGITGPTILLFIVLLLLLLSIVPKRQYWWWVALNIGMVIGLMIHSYFVRVEDLFGYRSRLVQHIDWAYSYVIGLLLIIANGLHVRNSSHKERLVSERKTAELAVANHTKNKLFSILGHDLRSPLNSIRSYLEVLTYGDLPEEEKLQLQQQLLAATINAEQLLSNLLLWSKNQISKITPDLKKVNLYETLCMTLGSLADDAQRKRVHLACLIDSGHCVMADGEMLTLVIRNLVNNAIKFTPEGGKVTVTSEVEGKEVTIKVTDTGMGISAGAQKAIFSSGMRSTYGTQHEKGVGMGLIFCREFTELQHGRIGFESKEGKGTTFYVVFPLCSSGN